MTGEYGPTLTYAGLKAAADLSAKEGHIVRLSAEDTVNQASEAVNSGVLGVLTNKPKADEPATVAYSGKVKAIAGAAITVGQFVSTNGSGRAITVVSGAMTVGRAMEATAADGDEFTLFVQPPTRWSGAV